MQQPNKLLEAYRKYVAYLEKLEPPGNILEYLEHRNEIFYAKKNY